MGRKIKFKKILNFDPYVEIPIFLDFLNFGPKFPDRELIMILWIIYFLKAPLSLLSIDTKNNAIAIIADYFCAYSNQVSMF